MENRDQQDPDDQGHQQQKRQQRQNPDADHRRDHTGQQQTNPLG